MFILMSLFFSTLTPTVNVVFFCFFFNLLKYMSITAHGHVAIQFVDFIHLSNIEDQENADILNLWLGQNDNDDSTTLPGRVISSLECPLEGSWKQLCPASSF